MKYIMILLLIILSACTTVAYDGKNISIISTKEYKVIEVEVYREGDNLYILFRAEGVTNDAEIFVQNFSEGVTKGLITGLKSGK